MRNSLRIREWIVCCLATHAALLLALQASTAHTQIRSRDLAARQAFLKKLVVAAVERTRHVVRYEPAYVRIRDPGGDVPAETGVCTDEIIRLYLPVGIQLQKEIHPPIEHNFSSY